MFGETPTRVFGEKLKDQVDDRLNYYEERKHQPMTNVKAMEDALKSFKSELKKSGAGEKEKQKRGRVCFYLYFN